MKSNSIYSDIMKAEGRETMNGHKVENIAAVISYIEAHLNEKLDLDTVANAVCYSKYHLHRMFTDTVGITLHDYIQRRQLTEAAKLLVFSESPCAVAVVGDYHILGKAAVFPDFKPNTHKFCSFLNGKDQRFCQNRTLV